MTYTDTSGCHYSLYRIHGIRFPNSDCVTRGMLSKVAMVMTFHGIFEELIFFFFLLCFFASSASRGAAVTHQERNGLRLAQRGTGHRPPEGRELVCRRASPARYKATSQSHVSCILSLEAADRITP